MILEVKWCGFDFGECIMDADGVRNPLVFGDICKEMGTPELIPDKTRKNRKLKEKYGGYPVLHEGHRNEIFELVLDGNPEAIALFKKKEQELFGTGEGLEEILIHLQGEGIETSVVSEMKESSRPLGEDRISRFIKSRNLDQYFKELITPLGKVDLRTDRVDPRYEGHTKREGTMYDILAMDLRERGIMPHEAAMVGDRPETDINPAHSRGFKTIQYTGYSHKGRSKADMVIDSFHELKDVFKGSPIKRP